jgi:polyisoprenoid-binding protein YceI
MLFLFQGVVVLSSVNKLLLAVLMICSGAVFAGDHVGTVSAQANVQDHGQSSLSEAMSAVLANSIQRKVLDSDDHLYEIQQDTSSVSFHVDSPVGEIWVKFDDFSGRFIMPKRNLTTRHAVVDINTESMNSETRFVGGLLKSDSFFDVENFPSIRFVGSNLEWYGEDRAVLKGLMTIQDVTLPVAFYIELDDDGINSADDGSISVTASTTIKRSAFGIYTLLPLVSDNVDLYVSIDANRIDTPLDTATLSFIE